MSHQERRNAQAIEQLKRRCADLEEQTAKKPNPNRALENRIKALEKRLGELAEAWNKKDDSK